MSLYLCKLRLWKYSPITMLVVPTSISTPMNIITTDIVGHWMFSSTNDQIIGLKTSITPLATANMAKRHVTTTNVYFEILLLQVMQHKNASSVPATCSTISTT